MAVANSHGESVRGIIRGRDFGQLQQETDHSLNLVFLSPTIADDGALYLQRRIFKDGNPLLCGGQEGHTAGMTQFQG